MALALSVVNEGKGPSPKLSLTGIKKKKRQRAAGPDEADDKVVRPEPSLINPSSSSKQATSLFSASTSFVLDTLSHEEAEINPESAKSLETLIETKDIEVSFVGAPDILSQEFDIASAIDDEEVVVLDKESEHQLTLSHDGFNASFTGAPDILSQEFDTDAIAIEEEKEADSLKLFQDKVKDSHASPTNHDVIDMSFNGAPDILSQEFIPVPIEDLTSMQETTADEIPMSTTGSSSIFPQDKKANDILVSLNELEPVSSPQVISRRNDGSSLDESNIDSSPASIAATPTHSPIDVVTLFGQAILSGVPQRPHSVRMFASQHPANSPCEDFWWAGTNAEFTASPTSTSSSTTATTTTSPDGLTYIFVVLDGHGGPVAASFGMTHLPKKIFEKIHATTSALVVVAGIKEAFDEVDRMYLSLHSHDLNFCKFGSCVNLVLLRKVILPSTTDSLPRWTIFTANVGDSRSVLSSQWDVERWGKESLTRLMPQARTQLLDPRVHNRIADAAGIPSLLAAGRPVDRTIDVIKISNECEAALVASVLHRRSYGGKPFVGGAATYRAKAECFDLHAKCIAYAVVGDTVSASSTSSPLPLALDQRRKTLRSKHFVAIPLSVDHTCANPLEAEDVKARCWDQMPIRPNILGYNPTFINRANEVISSAISSSTIINTTTSSFSSAPSLFQRSTSLKTSLQPQVRNPGMIDLSMHRVAGSLMVTRALGDHYLKSPQHSPPLFSSGCPYMSCEPEVHWRVVQSRDRFALMGCDGIWDNVTNAEAVEIVALSLQNEALLPVLEQLHRDLNVLRAEEDEGAVAVERQDPTVLFNSALSAIKDDRLVDKIGSPIPVLLSTSSSRNSSSSVSSSTITTMSSSSSTSSDSFSQTFGIERLEDIVFGNPAQRIVGASLLVAASRHVEAARRQRQSEISLELSVAALLAKSPKLSDPKQKDHRRGIHDDLTALVIAFPEFMFEENRLADDIVSSRSREVVGNEGGGSASSLDQSVLSRCAMEGVDSFVFPPPCVRFNKDSLDAQLAMRVQSRLLKHSHASTSSTSSSASSSSTSASGSSTATTSVLPVHVDKSANALLAWLGGGGGKRLIAAVNEE